MLDSPRRTGASFNPPVILTIQGVQITEDFLATVAGDVALTYETDKITSQTKKEREQLWRELSEAYPNFADKILDLKKELSRIPKESRGSFNGLFDAVENNTSRNLLGDILWIRIKNHVNNRTMQDSETDLMLKELNLKREQREEIENITPIEIISKVLLGELLF